jgi:hypothetical protein
METLHIPYVDIEDALMMYVATSLIHKVVVATPFWPSVRVKPNTWKSWRFGVLRDSRMFRA